MKLYEFRFCDFNLRRLRTVKLAVTFRLVCIFFFIVFIYPFPRGSPGYIPYIKHYHFCPLFNCCCQLETILLNIFWRRIQEKKRKKVFTQRKFLANVQAIYSLVIGSWQGRPESTKRPFSLRSKTLTFKSRLNAKPVFFSLKMSKYFTSRKWPDGFNKEPMTTQPLKDFHDLACVADGIMV